MGKKMTFEELRDLVSYEPDPSYVPSEFALKMITFMKMVGDSQPKVKSSIIHTKILDSIASKHPRIINVCARGMGKSTLIAYIILYIAVYGKLDNFGEVPYGIFIGASIDNNVKSMRSNLEAICSTSEFLKNYITWKFTDDLWTFTNIQGQSCAFRGFGAETGLRGTTHKGHRPVLCFLDDLIRTDKTAGSDLEMSRISDTIYKSVTYALHPTRQKIIWSGTPFNQSDILYEAVESGGWAVNLFPIAEKFDETTTPETFRGAWVEHFPYSAVKFMYEQAKSTARGLTGFNQEMMLQVISDEDRFIQDSDIQWYSREAILKYKKYYNFYITTDFAVSETESSDFSVISVWAYTADGEWYWVDGIMGKHTMDINVNELFRLVKKYRPMSVGIESSGQQKGFIAWLKQEMYRYSATDLSYLFNFARNKNSKQDGLRPTTNKIARFAGVVPLFKQKKVFFPEELKDTPIIREAMNEFSKATPSGIRSKHDDFIDTVSMILDLDAFVPEKVDFQKLEEQEGKEETLSFIDLPDYTEIIEETEGGSLVF